MSESQDNPKPTFEEIYKLIHKLCDLNFSKGVFAESNNIYGYKKRSRHIEIYLLRILEKIRAYGCNHE